MWAILRFIRRSTVLVGVGLVGGLVTTAGVVMLVTPGPGLLVIIAGLAILATQFAWAERALDKVKDRARAARDKASVRAGRPAGGAGRPGARRRRPIRRRSRRSSVADDQSSESDSQAAA